MGKGDLFIITAPGNTAGKKRGGESADLILFIGLAILKIKASDKGLAAGGKIGRIDPQSRDTQLGPGQFGHRGITAAFHKQHPFSFIIHAHIRWAFGHQHIGHIFGRGFVAVLGNADQLY